MPLSPAEWHLRFTAQAAWSADLRAYLFKQVRVKQVGIEHLERILDVGCGTGVLEAELVSGFLAGASTQVAALDIDPAMIAYAKTHSPGALYLQADAFHLPFPDRTFDLVFCHFLLLWLTAPAAALREMARLTRPGGHILALAEPDYGGRIDYPPELAALGHWQADSLQRQGADPSIGRQLKALFHQAGLQEVESGVLGGRWADLSPLLDDQTEWDILSHDLQFLDGAAGQTISPTILHRLRDLDSLARQRQDRILYVPTFYAMGRVV